MKRLKVGVIGCGVMGSFHLKQYRNIPDVEIAGVSDIDPSRAPADAKYFSDYKDLLKFVDAVSITTPTQTHFDIGIGALNEGCHVLMEKPIALTEGHAEKLISRAKALKRILAVGHIERFNPAYMAMTKVMGRARPDIIDIKRFSPFPERINDASAVIDMMIHDIDLARKLAGTEAKHVNATGKIIMSQRIDQALAVIVFNNGVVANIEVNRTFESKVRKIKAACGGTVYEADLLNRTAVKRDMGKSTEIPVKSFDQLNMELKDFVGAINGRRKPAVTGEDGMAALLIANMIEEAAIQSSGRL